jgi:hypothetical protein
MDPAPHIATEAGALVDREIDALRVTVARLDPDDATDRHRLLLGELLVGRALGVRPSLQAVYGVRAVTDMAVRLAGEESRQDLRDAVDQLTRAAASRALHPDELIRAGRWLGAIRRLPLDRPEPRDAGVPASPSRAVRPDDPHRPVLAARTTIERARRHRLAGRDPDLAALRRAYDELPSDHPDRAVAIAEIGLAYALVAERGDGPRASAVAAQTLTDALRRPAGDDALREEILIALATMLSGRYAAEPADDLLDQIITLTRPGNDPAHPMLAEAVHGLALVLRATDAQTAVLEELDRVGRILGAGHPVYGLIMGVLGAGLARRAEADGDLAMLATAEDRLARAAGDWTDMTLPGPAVRVPRAGGQVMRARLGHDPAQADRAIATLEAELTRLPSADPWTPRAQCLLGEAWRVRGELRDRAADVRRGCELLIAAGAGVPATHPDAARIGATAALARADLVRLDDDPADRDAAVRELAQAVDDADLTTGQRAELLARLVELLRARGCPGDAEHLAARLKQAHTMRIADVGGPTGVHDAGRPAAPPASPRTPSDDRRHRGARG